MKNQYCVLDENKLRTYETLMLQQRIYRNRKHKYRTLRSAVHYVGTQCERTGNYKISQNANFKMLQDDNKTQMEFSNLRDTLLQTEKDS